MRPATVRYSRPIGSAGMSILEVAKAAGVSTATVSRVLNELPGVRDETIQQVRAAVAALNYTPQRVRKAPRNGDHRSDHRPSRSALRTGSVAALTLGQPAGWLRMPVMAEAVSGIQRAATDFGLRLVLGEIADPHRPETALRGLQVDGAVVFVDSNLSPTATRGALRFLGARMPIVWAMGTETFASPVDHVTPNNITAGALAHDYLKSRGCHRMAYVCNDPHWHFMRLRGQAFLNAALDDGAAATAHIVTDQPLLAESFGARVRTSASLADLVDDLVDAPERPDGIFVANDLTAVSLYSLLAARGIRPGEDIRIVSCDNEAVRLSGLSPRPVSINICAEQVGYKAVGRLRERLQSPDEPPVLIQVAPHLEE